MSTGLPMMTSYTRGRIRGFTAMSNIKCTDVAARARAASTCLSRHDYGASSGAPQASHSPSLIRSASGTELTGGIVMF